MILYNAGVTHTVPFSRARSELAGLLDDVESRHEHVVVTRNGLPVAVLMSIAEFEALQETVEVLGDRDALEDLQASRKDIESGRVSDWEVVKRRLRRG